MVIYLDNFVISYNLEKKKKDKQKEGLKLLLDKPIDKNLEDEVNDQEINSEIIENIDYSFHEQQLLERTYQQENSKLDYEQLFSTTNLSTINSDFEDEYWTNSTNSINNSELLSNEEAEETFLNIQYAYLLGQSNDISLDQRRKFHWWIKENPALFNLFENMHALTRDVNYQQY